MAKALSNEQIGPAMEDALENRLTDVVESNVAMLRQGREGFGQIERDNELTAPRMVGEAKPQIYIWSQVVRIGAVHRCVGTGHFGDIDLHVGARKTSGPTASSKTQRPTFEKARAI